MFLRTSPFGPGRIPVASRPGNVLRVGRLGWFASPAAGGSKQTRPPQAPPFECENMYPAAGRTQPPIRLVHVPAYQPNRWLGLLSSQRLLLMSLSSLLYARTPSQRMRSIDRSYTFSTPSDMHTKHFCFWTRCNRIVASTPVIIHRCSNHPSMLQSSIGAMIIHRRCEHRSML